MIVEDTVVEETVVVVTVEVVVVVVMAAAGEETVGLLLAVIAGHFPVLMLQLPCVLEEELTFDDAMRVMSAYEACGVDPLEVEV